MGYPYFIQRVNVEHLIGVLHLVQSNIRDTYTNWIPENPSAPGSYECAACDGYSLIRTAGIVESSVGQKVDRGPEECHGHGFV